MSYKLSIKGKEYLVNLKPSSITAFRKEIINKHGSIGNCFSYHQLKCYDFFKTDNPEILFIVLLGKEVIKVLTNNSLFEESPLDESFMFLKEVKFYENNKF